MLNDWYFEWAREMINLDSSERILNNFYHQNEDQKFKEIMNAILRPREDLESREQ